MTSDQANKVGGRILALDLARTAALVAMAVYHFGYDLEAFGHIAPMTMVTGFWYWFARAVAGSFLFMVGLSLWLAHGRAIRWRAFLIRLAQVGAGAVLVSLGTRALFGASFVFFGILHSIVVASLLGLLFLRLPAILVALAAVGAFLAPRYLATGAFDHPWLIWTGLTTFRTRAVDFVPLFPWFGPVLAGIAVAKLVPWDRLRTGSAPSPLARTLAFPGRHSLAVYLIHQPVLFGAVAGLTRLGLL